MTRLLSIVSFVLLINSAFCCIQILNDELKRSLISSINREFDPIVTSAVERNNMFRPLLTVAGEIEYFLSGRDIDETIFDNLLNYVNFKVLETGARNSSIADSLLGTFMRICNSLKDDYTMKRKFLINSQALRTMADVCQNFKAPVQWLYLTSKVLGHANLFRDAPILLENIRRAFLEKFDPRVDSVNFKVKLKFIKDSFDFNFSKPESETGASSSIHLELKTEFMRQISVVISNLEKVSDPFVALSTGLGRKQIKFNLGSNLTSSNEDLWSFIIQRIENIRERIELGSSNLILHHGKSIIDLVISKILEKSQNNAPFLLKTGHIAIAESFNEYVSINKFVHEDETIKVDILKHEAEQIKSLFEDDLKKFNDELKNKIIEIKSDYGFTNFHTIKFDFSRIAVAAMAFEFLKLNQLEKFF